MTTATPRRPFGPLRMDWRDLEKVIALADAFALDLLVVKYDGKDRYNHLRLDWWREGHAREEKFLVLHVSPASTSADVRVPLTR